MLNIIQILFKIKINEKCKSIEMSLKCEISPFLSLLVINENFSAHKVSNEIFTELRPSDTRLDN